MVDREDGPLVFDLKAASLKAIVAGFFVSGIVGAISLFMCDYYTSEAKILPVDSKGSASFGQLSAAATALGVSLPGNDAGEGNLIDILNSRWMREQLLSVEYSYGVQSWKFGARSQHRGTLYQYLNAQNMDQAVSAVGGILSIAVDRKSRLMTIRAETKSPELSQQIVRQAQVSLELFIQGKGRTRGGAKAIFAERRLKDARGEMDKAEAELSQFISNNKNYATSSDAAIRLRGIRLENEFRLHSQVVQTLAINREQALLEEKNDLPILNILDAGNLPIEKSKPTRSNFVLFAFLLSAISAWSWLNRRPLSLRVHMYISPESKN